MIFDFIDLSKYKFHYLVSLLKLYFITKIIVYFTVVGELGMKIPFHRKII